MIALALVDAPEHVCCRYRIRAFAPALEASGWSLQIESLQPSSISRLLQYRRAAQFGTVILQRKLLPKWQLRELRRRCSHLVFDFDDAVLYRDSYNVRGPLSSRRADRFARVVQMADTVIAGNDFLADCALRAGARPDQVRVIPTCIETERYVPAWRRPQTDGAGIELVWIGSSSTLQGLEQQKPLWERLARAVPGVRLRLICDRFPNLGSMAVREVAWSEATEAAELAAGDVGIAWMPDDVWSRGKCGLKVLQYQAAGLPVIANPVGVHLEMVEPGISGFLAETPEEWQEAARTLARDSDLRRRMGREARVAVELGYSVSAWAPTFVAAIAGRRPVPPPKFESLRQRMPRSPRHATPTEGGGEARSRF